jgi:hypothetical protein
VLEEFAKDFALYIDEKDCLIEQDCAFSSHGRAKNFAFSVGQVRNAALSDTFDADVAKGFLYGCLDQAKEAFAAKNVGHMGRDSNDQHTRREDDGAATSFASVYGDISFGDRGDMKLFLFAIPTPEYDAGDGFFPDAVYKGSIAGIEKLKESFVAGVRLDGQHDGLFATFRSGTLTVETLVFTGRIIGTVSFGAAFATAERSSAGIGNAVSTRFAVGFVFFGTYVTWSRLGLAHTRHTSFLGLASDFGARINTKLNAWETHFEAVDNFVRTGESTWTVFVSFTSAEAALSIFQSAIGTNAEVACTTTFIICRTRLAASFFALPFSTVGVGITTTELWIDAVIVRNADGTLDTAITLCVTSGFIVVEAVAICRTLDLCAPLIAADRLLISFLAIF